AEARFQPILEPVDFLRITVAREDDLVLPFEELVERVEELFLRARLVREELDVIDEQRIERAIGRLEIVDLVVLERAHHVADEALRVKISPWRFRIAFFEEVSDRMNEMLFAETDTAIEEQRVVCVARILRHLQRRGFRELIALAFDEAREREIRI